MIPSFFESGVPEWPAVGACCATSEGMGFFEDVKANQNSVQMMRKFAANSPPSQTAHPRTTNARPRPARASNEPPARSQTGNEKKDDERRDTTPEVGLVAPLTGLRRGNECKGEERDGRPRNPDRKM